MTKNYTIHTFRCAWCEKSYQTRQESSSYCSFACSKKHRERGYGMNQRQLRALKARPAGPRGCSTVEEWLAAGGVIWRQEMPPLPMGGIPVRPKASDHSGGRVRR